jgi:3-oxoadipate enol-lactonase
MSTATVLLLLHAFPLDARMWEGQLPVLERAGYEVIAPNLPGREPDPELGRWAGRVLDLLPGDFVPVGISMGGYLAFELWRRAPRRIPAMALLDTRANADDEAGGAARGETIRRLREKGFDAFWDDLGPKLFSPDAPEEVVARGRAIAAEQPLESLVTTVEALRDRPDSTQTLGDIGVPVLVLVGEKDALTPPDAAKEIVGGLLDARYVELPGAGHLTPLERPHAVNEEILLFLHEALA